MVSPLAQFILDFLAVDEKAIRDRDTSLPIHFVGCYYYDNTLDANLHCDCDEDGEASKKALWDIESKRKLVERFQDDEAVLTILALPYQETL